MSYPASRAAATGAIAVGCAGIAWAAPDAAILAVLGLVMGVYSVWANA